MSASNAAATVEARTYSYRSDYDPAVLVPRRHTAAKKHPDHSSQRRTCVLVVVLSLGLP
jgi:hypothetical protein